MSLYQTNRCYLLGWLANASLMFVGGLIYFFWRSETVLETEWLSRCDQCQVLWYQGWLIGQAYSPPGWLLFQIPDFIWAFCFTLTLLLLGQKIKVTLSLVFLTAFIYEISQYLLPRLGTFDWADILAYCVGLCSAACYFKIVLKGE